MAEKFRLKVNIILGGEMLRAGMLVDKERIPQAMRKRDYVTQEQPPDSVEEESSAAPALPRKVRR